MNESSDSKNRDAATRIISLPDGYPAYCIYVPTGFDLEIEREHLSKLQEWGRNMGKNLFVADWNIGDPSYQGLMKSYGFEKRPAIILTDTNIPKQDSFKIVLDDPIIARDISKLKEILPRLLDLILVQQNSEAAKTYIEAKQSAKIRSLLGSIGSVLSKVKLTFTWKGVTVEV